MIIGAHVVVASKDAAADHEFFKDVLGLSAADAGGGYLIFGLPASEASIHSTDGQVPHHELYFLCDDVDSFAAGLSARDVEHGEVQDAGWGLVLELTLPSGRRFTYINPGTSGQTVSRWFR